MHEEGSYMTYIGIVEGRFVRRLNRFIAEVIVEDETVLVHVKNTGRCKELFIEGTKVFLEKSTNPNRKTNFSLIGLYKGQHMINIDSQVPNQVVFESLLAGEIKEIQDVTYAKREVTYGKSRFDIYYETASTKGFIEVKGVTLEEDGLAKFPDAPTERGTKHIKELTEGLKEGYKNYVCFLIQMAYVDTFRPHHERDLKLAKALYTGLDQGLGILIYNCTIGEDSIDLKDSCHLLPKSF